VRTRAAVSVRLVQVGFVVAFLLAWYAVGRRGLVNPLLLPRLDSVYRDFVSLVGTGQVFQNLRTTIYELAVAYLIAAVAGMGVGYVVGSSRFRTRVFEPLLASLYAVPIIVFFPLCVLFFGLGPASKIAFGAVFGFFPVALNTISGFGQLDRRLVDVARSMGASNLQMFRRVLFPGALPQILTGLRTGLILTFIAVVAGEMVSSLQGIGYMISWLGELMETSRMYAYILLIVLMAMALNGLLSLLGSHEQGRG
jgi:ABC-type nitrate/sulfonate/bicarbonate transport system permease component